MADSNFFNGDNFKGIDDAATENDSPFSSVLEGRMANNNHWLHRFGGGCTVRATEANGLNNTFLHHSAIWSALSFQPFYVTKGLSKIRLVFQGIITGYDVEARVQLGQLFSATETWSSGAGHLFRSIELDLPYPADFDYDTDLILWIRCKMEGGYPPSGEAELASMSDGYGNTTVALFDAITDTTQKTIVAYSRANFAADPATAAPRILEPLVRIIDLKADDLDYFSVTPVDTLSDFVIGEREIAYVTIRSIQVRQEFA